MNLLIKKILEFKILFDMIIILHEFHNIISLLNENLETQVKWITLLFFSSQLRIFSKDMV